MKPGFSDELSIFYLALATSREITEYDGSKKVEVVIDSRPELWSVRKMVGREKTQPDSKSIMELLGGRQKKREGFNS